MLAGLEIQGHLWAAEQLGSSVSHEGCLAQARNSWHFCHSHLLPLSARWTLLVDSGAFPASRELVRETSERVNCEKGQGVQWEEKGLVSHRHIFSVTTACVTLGEYIHLPGPLFTTL